MLEQMIAKEVSNVANGMDGVVLSDEQAKSIALLISLDIVPPDVCHVELSEFETLSDEDDWSDVNNAISKTITWYLQQEAAQAAMEKAVDPVTRQDGTRVSLEDVVRVEVLENIHGQRISDEQLDNVVTAIANYTRSFVLPDMVSDLRGENEQEPSGKDWFCGDCEEAFETPLNAQQVHNKACPYCHSHNITYTPDRPD